MNVRKIVLWAVMGCLAGMGLGWTQASTSTPNCVETTVNNIDGNGNTAVTRTYTDGLGRTIQTHSKINTVNGTPRYLISGSKFDDLGRPDTAILPKPYDRNGYLPNALDKKNDNADLLTGARSYYNDITAPDADGFPFSQTRYFEDPLNRVFATGAPGKPFSFDPSEGHPGKTWYFGSTGSVLTNYFDADGFLVTDRLNDIDLDGYDGTTEVTTSVPKKVSELAESDVLYFLTVTKDPNKHYSQELKDVFGKTIKAWSSANGTDPVVSSYSYDFNGNITIETAPQTSSDPVESTRYTYNTLGQLLEKTTPDATGTFYYRYDNAGRLLQVTDPNYNVIQYGYDALGRNSHVYQRSSHTIKQKMQNIYDDPEGVRGYLENITYGKGEIITPAQLDGILSTLHNTQGRLVASIAYDDVAERNYHYYHAVWVSCDSKVMDLFSYDEDGRIDLKYKIIPGVPLQKLQYEYDLQGNIVQTSLESCADPTEKVTTIYSYNVQGQLEKIIRNDKEFVRYEYNDLGQMTKKIFASGTPGSRTVQYAYNIQGWTKKIWTDNDKFVENVYYEKNGSTGTNQYNGNISRAKITTGVTVSDGFGNTTTPEAANLDLLYSYDNVDRLTNVNNSADATTNDEFDADFSYLPDGRTKSKNEGTLQHDWGDYIYYPTSNKLMGITGTSRLGDPDEPNYIYDNNGNLVFDRSKKMIIQYDWRNLPKRFLTFSEILHENTGTNPSKIVTWNDVKLIRSNPKQMELNTSEIFMTYDAQGNRVSKEHIIQGLSSTIETPPEEPPPNTNLPSMEVVNVENGASFTFTPEGTVDSKLPMTDMIIEPPAGALLIAADDEVREALSPIGFQSTGTIVDQNKTTAQFKSLTFSLTAPGAPSITQMHLSSTSGDVGLYGEMPSIWTVHGKAYIDDVAEFSLRLYYYGLLYAYVGTEGLSQPGNYFEFYVKDHLGSNRLVFTEDGEVKEATAYLAYGKMMSMWDVPGKAPRKFTGKEFDEEGGIGAYYFGARYYDPEIGIFQSTDPAGEFFNSYRYTTNPVGFVDPSGMAEWTPSFSFGPYSYYDQSINTNWNSQHPVSSFSAMDVAGLAYLVYGGAVNLAGNALGPWVSPVLNGINSVLDNFGSSEDQIQFLQSVAQFPPTRIPGSALLASRLARFTPAVEEAAVASKSTSMISFKIPASATAEEIAQMRQYAALSNEALKAGYLSPSGRVSTAGALRADASAATAAERARATSAGTPYIGHAGHVPDPTWTGQAIPYTWLDLSPRINMSLGSQAAKFPIGIRPSGFQVVPR